MKKSTLEEIVKVVVEMNEKLGLKPAIETEGATKDSLRAELKFNATEMVPADKKLFSPESWNFLAGEGMLDHLPKVEASKAPEKPVEKPAATPKKNEVKKEESKPAATPKAGVKPKVEKESGPKDEYGFTIGSPKHLFVEHLKKGPAKMKDIKEAAWNEKKRTFYHVFEDELVANGKAKKEDGTLILIGYEKAAGATSAKKIK
jgi:hypothetical protein